MPSAPLWDLAIGLVPSHRPPPSPASPEPPTALTSVVLHPGVMGDALRAKAEAQDVTRVRTVSDQKGPIRFPLQLHLRVLPVHRSPVPPALGRETERTSADASKEDFISDQTQYDLLSLLIPFKCQKWKSPVVSTQEYGWLGLAAPGESAPSHPLHHPEVAKEQMRLQQPSHAQQNASLDSKTSAGERQEGFFFSPILILCSQLCTRDDRSPKPA